MAITLLLDLDDTLLNTNVGEFLPAYFRALSGHLQNWIKPDAMLPALLSGVQLMLDNQDPSVTLQQVFESHFYPMLGIDKATLQQPLEDFYDTVFPGIGGVTRPRAGAADLVNWALERGDRVIIATDPLFPRKAVLERIRWAGLDPERFELISSFETFHFSKSHPEYYAEVLGQLGWPDGPVLMVGNDEDRDLACAEQLGLATYQIVGANAPVAVPHAEARPNAEPLGRGTLTDLRNWLESSASDSMVPSSRSQRATLAILRASPAALQGMTTGMSPEQWMHEPSPDDWAMLEIVCHMRDTEREVHREQVRTLLDEPQPFVPRPDAAVWAKQRKYLNENGPSALREFAAARKETLAALRGLDQSVWQRAARHAIFGPTHFLEVVGFMADHDRLHIQQAWRTVPAPS